MTGGTSNISVDDSVHAAEPERSGLTPDVTLDAVVIVPGIMGSALTDTATGREVWGLRDPRWLGTAWTHRDGVRPLHLDAAEQAGHYGRIRATGLLAAPAWAPFLRGVEPYTELLRVVRASTAHESAVLAFAYDWRLPVAVNGVLLAEAAGGHIEAWRASMEYDRARRLHTDRPEARLVFIAHSMGGLVTRAALAHAAGSGSGLAADTRTIVTLGTPFLGAVNSALILNGHRSTRILPRKRLQALARNLPGVYDLLPDYRCVDTGRDVLRLTAADIEALGGNAELARSAWDFQHRMREPAPPMPGHVAVVGTAQPTAQSLRLVDGLAHPQNVAFQSDAAGQYARGGGVLLRRDRAGDGTVYRDAATPGPDVPVTAVPVTHGALARDSHVLAHIRAVLTEQRLGPLQGGGELGLDLPDSADAGATWLLRLVPEPGVTLDTHVGIACSVHDAQTDRRVGTPRFDWYDGAVAAEIALPAPGLFRVRVKSGGRAPISQLVLATDPAADLADDD